MRFGLHRRTDLALRALHVLDETSDLFRGIDLARAIGTSANYLPQVMAPLVRAGWVTSERGPTGGYRLAAGAQSASLLEVIEGPIAGNECVLRGGPCPRDATCPLHPVWTEVATAMVNQLGSSSVLGATNGGQP